MHQTSQEALEANMEIDPKTFVYGLAGIAGGSIVGLLFLKIVGVI